MKKTKFNEKTAGELKAAETQVRKEILNLRVEREQRKLKNLHAIDEKKKELARILTAARVKELSK